MVSTWVLYGTEYIVENSVQIGGRNLCCRRGVFHISVDGALALKVVGICNLVTPDGPASSDITRAHTRESDNNPTQTYQILSAQRVARAARLHMHDRYLLCTVCAMSYMSSVFARYCSKTHSDIRPSPSTTHTSMYEFTIYRLI